MKLQLHHNAPLNGEVVFEFEWLNGDTIDR